MHSRVSPLYIRAPITSLDPNTLYLPSFGGLSRPEIDQLIKREGVPTFSLPMKFGALSFRTPVSNSWKKSNTKVKEFKEVQYSTKVDEKLEKEGQESKDEKHTFNNTTTIEINDSSGSLDEVYSDGTALENTGKQIDDIQGVSVEASHESRDQLVHDTHTWKVLVKTWDKKMITLEVQHTDQISYIKRKIQDKMGISTNLQRLFLKQKQLENERTLSDYLASSQDILELILLHRGILQIDNYSIINQAINSAPASNATLQLPDFTSDTGNQHNQSSSIPLKSSFRRGIAATILSIENRPKTVRWEVDNELTLYRDSSSILEDLSAFYLSFKTRIGMGCSKWRLGASLKNKFPHTISKWFRIKRLKFYRDVLRLNSIPTMPKSD
ncbi:hypothetical protein G9A89_014815 [Geosiphon pyriformis]|nr:hypothetical protein G9A89_014815 [Geosiphon pyriformis]